MDIFNTLSYLFGSEDYVKLRRQLVLSLDHLTNLSQCNVGSPFSVICSGSVGEGIEYPASDLDMMYFSSFDRVVNTVEDATQKNDLQIIYSMNAPGYCLLHVMCVSHSYRSDVIKLLNGMPFLSSIYFKNTCLAVFRNIFKDPVTFVPLVNQTGSPIQVDFNIRYFLNINHLRKEDESLHGPCLSLNMGYEKDVAFCFRSPVWPVVANRWITRNRLHDWPSRKIIQSIVDQGCHVVPIGCPVSSLSDHEWRISFSLAERTLMHSLNHVQFLTYNLLRLILKRLIETKLPGVLCSYYMKTTLFYAIEKTSVRIWQVNEFGECLRTCLGELNDYVDNRYIPNYFIPENNMINVKVNHINYHQLLDIIRDLYKAGIFEILDRCGESSILNRNLSLGALELQHDFNFMNSFHLKLAVQQFIEVLCQLIHIQHACVENLLFSIFKLLSEKKIEKLKGLFFTRGVIFSGQEGMDKLLRIQTFNKRDYRLHKSIESLFRIGYRGDLTSGKLTAATYMYLIGKTKSALLHIRVLLSEYPPYVIDCSSPSIPEFEVYEKVMCSRGYTIDFKARSAFATLYRLDSIHLCAFPMTLRIWISTQKSVVLDPLSYAYFLESLCHLRLQNHSSLLKSIRCLIKNIQGPKDDFYLEAKMCVGILKYGQGDCQSACRWLGSICNEISEEDISSQMFDHRRSVFIYIACMLNNRFGKGN